jgi:hypothetical protein
LLLRLLVEVMAAAAMSTMAAVAAPGVAGHDDAARGRGRQ